jgi:lysyl-tRNA synthetase class 1
VEWAAKFSVMNVNMEGGGKDHSTRGGSREIADAISREIFKREPPLNIPYEFFLVGGKKMSSSKGAGSSSREVADLLPPELLRFLLIQKEPQRVIDFIPDGDTIPVLYDTYDKFAENYFSGNDDDFAKVFRLAHLSKNRTSIKKTVMPRFSQVAYLVQMPHVDIVKEIEKLVEKTLNKDDLAELDSRIKYANIWLQTWAPEDYKFEIQQKVPEAVKAFSPEQKNALGKVLEYVQSISTIDGQTFHTKLHEIKTELNMPAGDFFSAIYLSILGKKNGPKAGWFLSVLPKNFLEKRLQEASR